MIKITTEEFIRRSIVTHGDCYDYSKSICTGAMNQVSIICKQHGMFVQQANVHYNGSGCPLCSNNIKSSKDDFIAKSKAIFGDLFDYSLVEYSNNKTPVLLICKVHGEFNTRPDTHLSKGYGCRKCKIMNMFSNTEEFIKKANIIHDSQYNYSEVDYINNRSRVKIICHEHGEFEQTPLGHLSGYGCKKCHHRKSRPEKIIERYLTDKKITFISEARFDDCRNVQTLPFDFYISEMNLIIEYDGKQHFKEIDCWGGEKTLTRIKHHDRIKNNYCEDKGIKLVRINYKQNLLDELDKLFR